MHERASSSIPLAGSVLILACLILLTACRSPRIAIAAIPRTTATPIWEAEHLGIEVVALQRNIHIYWNAPTREDDTSGQIAMVERVMNQRYDGLILAPDNVTALLAPVERVLKRGLPVVIVGASIPLNPSPHLCFLLNNEQVGGQLAASRLAAVVPPRGKLAILGVDADIPGMTQRLESLVAALHQFAPGLQLIDVRSGTFDEDHERQVSLDVLTQHPDLDAIVTLSSATTHGLLQAMTQQPSTQMKIVSYDRDDDDRLLFDTPNIDAIVIEDTEQMGAQATREILNGLRGQTMCSSRYFDPVLVTRDNLARQTYRLRAMLTEIPPDRRWRWMVNP